MAKSYLGYTPEDKKGEIASFYNENICQATTEIKRVCQLEPLADGSLPDFDLAYKLEGSGYGLIENGFTVGADGSIRVAALTDMPGVSPDMWDWWFGWHGCQDQRYKLWHPRAHVSARWEDGRSDLCYIGRNSIIREYIGPNLLDASIQFKSPLEFGFSAESLKEKGKQLFICARIGHPTVPVDFGYLIHQVRVTERGSEMRSRFWLGGKYIASRGDFKVPEWALRIGKTLKTLPNHFAQDLLVHCSEEMGHLARFLPELYQTFHTNDFAISGHTIFPGQANFDSVVLGTLFNKWDSGKRPALIVEPRTVEDVIQTVKYAKRVGKKIAISSGGHSFSANFIREGSVLMLMKHFNTYSVNKEFRVAQAGPGVGGSDLLKALYAQELFFPAGHCKGVCIGGYLLQGGYGWNGRKLGIACQHILAMDIVTADGELVHANEKENADLFWAARGSGPGFFGIVVKFYLQLFPLPKYRGVIYQTFGMKDMEETYRWAHGIGPAVSKAVEFQLLMNRNVMGFMGPGMEVLAPIFADTKEEFEEAKRFINESPIRKKAKLAPPCFDPGIELMYRSVMLHYPENHLWGVDNMWTHASIDELMPHIREISQTLPPAPSHFLWLNWQPDQIPNHMAHNKEDKLYLALYSCWKNPKDSAKYGKWAFETMRKMEYLSTGIQLADEGLHQRTFRFMSDANLETVQSIRAKWDPDALFFEWHSKPKTRTIQSV